jgi:hypothetical protein
VFEGVCKGKEGLAFVGVIMYRNVDGLRQCPGWSTTYYNLKGKLYHNIVARRIRFREAVHQEKKDEGSGEKQMKEHSPS